MGILRGWSNRFQAVSHRSLGLMLVAFSLWSVTLTPVALVAFAAPPSVNARSDQTLTDADITLLIGAISDDALPDPDTAVNARWSVMSDPGVVEFAKSREALTTATFSAVGSYVLRLTVGNGSLSGNDGLTVTVTADPPTTILVPGDYPRARWRKAAICPRVT